MFELRTENLTYLFHYFNLISKFPHDLFFMVTADGSCAGVQCNENAQCTYTEDNSRKCVCNSGYKGDGETCSREYM